MLKKIQILSPASPIFKNITDEYIDVFQSHKDKVNDVPPNFDIIAIDGDNIIQAIENKKFNIWGFQFHPEGLFLVLLTILVGREEELDPLS